MQLRSIRIAVSVVLSLALAGAASAQRDAEDLYGPLHSYEAVEEANPNITDTLVMGPWRHGGWVWTEGDKLAIADFGFKTSKTFQERALLPFFRHHLKGEGVADLPEAWVFETGANRWREFPTWPPEDRETRRVGWTTSSPPTKTTSSKRPTASTGRPTIRPRSRSASSTENELPGRLGPY